MFCKKCGNSLPEGVKFCKRCGNKVESKTSAPAGSGPAATPAPQYYNAPQYNAPQQNAPQYNTPQYNTPQNNSSQYNTTQYNAAQYNTPQNNTPQYNPTQYNNMPQQNAPQYNAPQYNTPQYGAPILVPPKKPSSLKYLLIPTGILAAAAILITVLITTLNSNQSVPASESGYEQSSSGGNKGSGSSGGNTSSNSGGNSSVNSGKPFVAGGKEYNLVNSVYSNANGGTVFLFEGTLNDTAIMIVAAATNGFEYPATYNQSSFGNTMEVGVYMVNTNTGACVVGSSSSQGLSGAQITTNANMTISVSGTLKNGSEDIPFSVNSKTTNTDMNNISEKVIAYASIAANNGSGGGGGNAGGGNQPVKCLNCSSRGVGKCKYCDGKGTCPSCVSGMDHCISCNGSRICKHCGGTTLCEYCGGDGILYN